MRVHPAAPTPAAQPGSGRNVQLRPLCYAVLLVNVTSGTGVWVWVWVCARVRVILRVVAEAYSLRSCWTV